MKKKSRFLTGLLSAVMALSLCALPAAADDAATVQNTDVWGTTTASITIHKYEYNRSEGDTGTPAPGTELETNKIPEGAKPLEGVTFKIYKVQDRNTLAEYYSGKNLTDEKFEKFTDVNKYYQESNDTFTVKDGNGKVVTGSAEQKTGKDGKATFSIDSNDLGLYLVVETDAPDKVKTKQIPFLVSVPMKNPKDQVNWLYNINVYPKNATQYGGVTVKKVGITGSDAEVNLSGVTFKLYKDVKGVWTEVTNRDDDRRLT